LQFTVQNRLAIRVRFWGARNKDFPFVMKEGWAEPTGIFVGGKNTQVT